MTDENTITLELGDLQPEHDILGVAPMREIVTSEDGWMIDADTGEVVGHVDTSDGKFHVTDRNSAEWVLAKIADADAEIAAIDVRRQAFLSNLAKQEAKADRQKTWLLASFKYELERFAGMQLQTQKTRTLQLDHGNLSFRTIRGGAIEVRDTDRAIAWAEHNAPDAIKTTKSILKTPLKHLSETGYVVLPEDIFDVSETRTEFEIKTGVKK